MIKQTLLIKSLSSIASDMKDAATDLKDLFPETNASEQLINAAAVLAKWVDNIQQGAVK